MLAASQIATALADHDGPVTAVVPHYAMSGGTMIALAADEIVLDRHAAWARSTPSSANIPRPRSSPLSIDPERTQDETLILGDIAWKALRQVEAFATKLLERRMSPVRTDVAHLLASGTWTHDHPRCRLIWTLSGSIRIEFRRGARFDAPLPSTPRTAVSRRVFPGAAERTGAAAGP